MYICSWYCRFTVVGKERRFTNTLSTKKIHLNLSSTLPSNHLLHNIIPLLPFLPFLLFLPFLPISAISTISAICTVSAISATVHHLCRFRPHVCATDSLISPFAPYLAPSARFLAPLPARVPSSSPGTPPPVSGGLGSNFFRQPKKRLTGSRTAGNWVSWYRKRIPFWQRLGRLRRLGRGVGRGWKSVGWGEDQVLANSNYEKGFLSNVINVL